MTEIRFYHLQYKTLEEALPEILEKAIARGMRAVVMAETEERVAQLDDVLWSWNPDSFLPHGSGKSANAEHHPIWLTIKDENPNKADLLILIDQMGSDHVADYKLCCEIFDANNEQSLTHARAKWKEYGETDYTLTYWQQDEQRKWAKKTL